VHIAFPGFKDEVEGLKFEKVGGEGMSCLVGADGVVSSVEEEERERGWKLFPAFFEDLLSLVYHIPDYRRKRNN
jgi:hypothetical protein